MTETEEMPPTFTFDNVETEPTPDTVAARSQSYEFAGKPLEPFSKTRQSTASRMGVAVFNMQKAARIFESMKNGNGYDEQITDAIRTVWLCTVPIHRVKKAQRNDREVEAAQDESAEWWERNGGSFGSSQFNELTEIFFSIIQDIFTVSAETDSAGTGGANDSLGE
jgi:hypothetical protein